MQILSLLEISIIRLLIIRCLRRDVSFIKSSKYLFAEFANELILARLEFL